MSPSQFEGQLADQNKQKYYQRVRVSAKFSLAAGVSVISQICKGSTLTENII